MAGLAGKLFKHIPVIILFLSEICSAPQFPLTENDKGNIQLKTKQLNSHLSSLIYSSAYCAGNDTARFSHLKLGIHRHSTLQSLSSSIRVGGTAIFRWSLQRCSVGFKSGLLMGYSRGCSSATLMLFCLCA